jgi:hypothetical protein
VGRHSEIVALPGRLVTVSNLDPTVFSMFSGKLVDQRCAEWQDRSRRLTDERTEEMENGEAHHTPAMKEALAKLAARAYGD